MIKPNNKNVAGWPVPIAVPITVSGRFDTRSVNLDLTRFFDIVISLALLVLFAPLLLIVAVAVRLSSQGEIIFKQQRVGKHGEEFTLFKFRTMYVNKHDGRSLTVGKNDRRITRIGRFLRRYKLDELPQLVNVLINDMSIVGPRPELRKYVDLYTEDQRQILSIKPGITDFASILCRNENELLGSKQDYEQYYIERLIPLKIRLNRIYKDNRTIANYFTIIFKTAFSIMR